jgi:hypothetical protein
LDTAVGDKDCLQCKQNRSAMKVYILGDKWEDESVPRHNVGPVEVASRRVDRVAFVRLVEDIVMWCEKTKHDLEWTPNMEAVVVVKALLVAVFAPYRCQKVSGWVALTFLSYVPSEFLF